MIMADKIIQLRKQAGWSQEELAEQLGVTRQSVSKWESAQSVPDINKILQMSRIFCVTTDYLLKDELEMPEAVSEPEYTPLRRVTMEEASAYLSLREKAAVQIAAATFLCILAVICLIFLAAMGEFKLIPVSEDVAAGIGICVMLCLVAIACVFYITCGIKVKPYEFLDTEPFETEYGVEGMVRERMQKFQPSYARANIVGTVLCILSLVPLFLAGCMTNNNLILLTSLCLMLFLVAIGVVCFIVAGVNHEAMERLLEEGDYTRKNKARRAVTGTISTIYWLIVTAIFLWYTFGPQGNGQPQYGLFIWPVAGVLYAAVLGIYKLIEHVRGGTR